MTEVSPAARETAITILAGGRGRRLGGTDKALMEVAGRPLLAHVLDRLRPQGGTLLLNSNTDPARLARFGLPVMEDALPGHLGPLVGVLTGMLWARAWMPEARWLLSVPVDCPLLPMDLLTRLYAAAQAEGAQVAVARSGDARQQSACALWSLDLVPLMREALEAGVRKVQAFQERLPLAVVTWDAPPPDPFLNVNTPADLAAAETALLRALS